MRVAMTLTSVSKVSDIAADLLVSDVSCMARQVA